MKVVEASAEWDPIEGLKFKSNPSSLRDEVLIRGNVLLFKSIFEREASLSLRERFFRYGQGEPSSNPKVESGSPNFHRFDENNPKQSKARVMHNFSVFYWNKDFLESWSWLKASLAFQRVFSQLPANFGNTGVEGDYFVTGRVSHYPLGGGHMQRHIDIDEVEKVTVIVSLSKRSEDFDSGGAYLQPDGEPPLDLEPYVDIGDIIVFNHAIPHGVAPIDPSEKLDWNNPGGRWMCFTTIARSETFQGLKEKGSYPV